MPRARVSIGDGGKRRAPRSSSGERKRRSWRSIGRRLHGAVRREHQPLNVHSYLKRPSPDRCATRDAPAGSSPASATASSPLRPRRIGSDVGRRDAEEQRSRSVPLPQTPAPARAPDPRRQAPAACRTTMPTTSPRLAPSARRMPISRVRCDDGVHQHAVDADARQAARRRPRTGSGAADRRAAARRRRRRAAPSSARGRSADPDRERRRCARSGSMSAAGALAAAHADRHEAHRKLRVREIHGRTDGARLGPKSCTSRATPTTVPPALAPPCPMRVPSVNSCPIALSSGHSRRAAVSLTITTGSAPEPIGCRRRRALARSESPASGSSRA